MGDVEASLPTRRPELLMEAEHRRVWKIPDSARRHDGIRGSGERHCWHSPRSKNLSSSSSSSSSPLQWAGGSRRLSQGLLPPPTPSLALSLSHYLAWAEDGGACDALTRFLRPNDPSNTRGRGGGGERAALLSLSGRLLPLKCLCVCVRVPRCT